MGLRRKSRELALQLLFAQDRAPLDAAQSAEFWDSAEAPEAARGYAEDLADLVATHRDDLDAVIARYAQNWTLARMSRVDRNLLRMAVAELFFVADVPVRVTLDEAVEIAKRYGGDDSGRFINGILDRIARDEAHRVMDDEHRAEAG